MGERRVRHEGAKGSFAALGAALTIGCVGALGAWALMASQGCALSNCDSAFVDYTQARPDGAAPLSPGGSMTTEFPDARLLDSNTWESAPEIASWHPFEPQHTYALQVPFKDGVPVDVLVYLAVDQDPIYDDAGHGTRNAALGTGNIAETLQFGNIPFVQIRNDSCAHYFFRVVVHAYGDLSPAQNLDAGTSPVSDAPTDAPSDTISDAALDVAESGPIDASLQ